MLSSDGWSCSYKQFSVYSALKLLNSAADDAFIQAVPVCAASFHVGSLVLRNIKRKIINATSEAFTAVKVNKIMVDLKKIII
jgi:hypothetical protein